MKNFLGLIFFVINLYASSQELGGFRGLHSRSLPDITPVKIPIEEPLKKSSPVMLSCKDRGEEMLNLGLGCARRGDEDNAMKWFLEAAQYNESRAMNYLGVGCMKKGCNDTAKFWFSKGAALGNITAKYNLACLYQTCLYQKNDNVKEAISLYTEIANESLTAKNNLAVILYEQGNEEEALQLWKKAEAEGCLSAIFNLAWAAEKRGDIETAKIGYKQSADKGDSDGMFYLAALYEKQEDFLSAKYWYNKAAEKGNKEAELKVKELGSGHLLRRKCKRMLSFYKSP